jgi:hypothetical protein
MYRTINPPKKAIKRTIVIQGFLTIFIASTEEKIQTRRIEITNFIG